MVEPEVAAFPFLLTLGLFIVSFVATALLAPKPELEDRRPAGLGDFQVPTATEGRPIPVIFGRVRQQGPNVIWYGDFKVEPIKKKVKTGVFSSERITVGFRYYLGLQFAICRGPDVVLKSIFIDDSSVDNGSGSISAPNLFGGEGDGTNNGGGVSGSYNFYDGSETQAVDTYLSTTVGLDPIPAYRGTAHVVWKQGWVGNSSNLRLWSFEVERFPSALLGSGDPDHKIGDYSCNPMEVLYEILTNDEWGMNKTPSEINVANLQAIAATLATEGNGFCYLWDREQKIGDLIAEIERQVDGIFYVDPVTGLYDFKLARDDYTPSTLTVIDESKITSFKHMSRPAWTDTFNFVYVRWSDPAQNFAESYALAQDMGNQEIVQEINTTQVAFPGCKDKTLANKLAWRELRALSYPAAKGTIEVDRSLYGIFPGSVYKLTWSALGISELIIRIANVDYGTLENPNISVEWVQDIYASVPGTFSDPTDTGWDPPEMLPEAFLAADQLAIEAPYILNGASTAPTSWPRIITMARKSSGSAVRYAIRSRDSATPGGQIGSYSELAKINTGFTPIGTITASLLGYDSSLPSEGSEDIVVAPLSGETLDDLIDTILDEERNSYQIGLCVIEPGTANEEWIVVGGDITDNGANIQLNNCYRGALDTAVKAHSSGARIWFTWFGGLGISESTVTDQYYFDVKLIPISPTEELDEGDATAVTEFQTDTRYGRPLIPTELNLNGSRYPASVDMSASDLDVSYTRRNWRTTGCLNSVLGKNSDGTTFNSPSDDDLDYNWWLYDLVDTPTPSGRGDAILNGSVTDGAASFTILKTAIEAAAVGGTVPTSMRIEIEAEHSAAEVAANTVSREVLEFDFGATT